MNKIVICFIFKFKFQIFKFMQTIVFKALNGKCLNIQTKLSELDLIQMDKLASSNRIFKVVNHCFGFVINNLINKIVNIFCSGSVNSDRLHDSSSSILMVQATAVAERNHSHNLSLPRQLRKVGDQPKDNYLGGSESAFKVKQW